MVPRNVVRELSLASVPAAMLDFMRPWAWDFVPKDAVVLRGGTVLAARWGHRESTDVDLFCTEDAWTRLDHQGLRSAGNQRLGKSLTSFILEGSALAMLEASGGSATLFVSPDLTESPRAPNETVEGIAVHSTEEVLYRMLRERMVETRRFLVRDIYDVAVAAEVDRSSLDRALARLTDDHRIMLALNVLHEPSDFNKEPLRKPRYKNLSESGPLRHAFRRIVDSGCLAR